MLWFKKKKPAPPPAAPAAKPSREEIIAQARANMRGARERIGDDEIKKMAQSLFGEKDDNPPDT